MQRLEQQNEARDIPDRGNSMYIKGACVFREPHVAYIWLVCRLLRANGVRWDQKNKQCRYNKGPLKHVLLPNFLYLDLFSLSSIPAATTVLWCHDPYIHHIGQNLTSQHWGHVSETNSTPSSGYLTGTSNILKTKPIII